MGFGKKGKNSFTINRSEEVLPGEMRGALSRGSSASSDGEGSADGDRFALCKIVFLLFDLLAKKKRRKNFYDLRFFHVFLFASCFFKF
jgi:hypothetical protein